MNKSLIIAITTLTALAAVAYFNISPQEQPITNNLDTNFEHFLKFKQQYRKNYENQHVESYRQGVFNENLKYLSTLNPNQPFGVTKFMDLTQEEFKQIYLTAKGSENLRNNKDTLTLIPNPNEDSVDWVSRGAVQSVKDQGACGSCWAFGAAGVLESHYFINQGELPNLSEQQLVDCSTWLDQNHGCDGGMHNRALNYVKRNGITTQSAYPYKAVQETCRVKGGSYRINGTQFITSSESAFIASLQQQPSAVYVAATNWQFYNPSTQRVLSECSDQRDHVVLAVGYDQESFKIKNSWGTDWGVNGYMYLKRGQNTCQVYSYAVIPV